MGSGPSKERTWGATIRAAEEAARAARQRADNLACKAWNLRMEHYGGPAQPSPTLGDALNSGYRFLEVKCRGCETHSTVDLTIIRRPKETPVWHLEGALRCRPCSRERGFSYKRGSIVRLRRQPISMLSSADPWYPGDERDRH